MFNNGSSPTKGRGNNDGQVDTRGKKHQNLQSAVFGGGYLDGNAPAYDPEVKRTNVGTT